MTEAETALGSDTRATRRSGGASGWRWGIATLAVVALILGGTFAAHSVIAKLRRPTDVAAAALPPLSVVAVTAPGTGYELTALDTSLGHVVALVSDHQPQCPPRGACPAPPALDRFVVLDGATGQTIASTPLTGEAANDASAAEYLLVDDASHYAYAVEPENVAVFSTETGAFITDYPLPAFAAGATVVGATYDGAQDIINVLGSDGEISALHLAGSPAYVYSVSAPAGQYEGIALDANDRLLYLLRRDPTDHGATLLVLDWINYSVVAQAPVGVNATLGAFDPATNVLSLLGADGMSYRATYLDFVINVAQHGPANALALGGADALGHTYVARDGDVEALDASGKAVAALPLRAYGGSTLLTDPVRNLLYVTANDGALVIAQDAATEPRAALTSGTAILLARAALPHYLPDTAQDPQFLDTETFWPGASTPLVSGGASDTIAENYWIHDANRGWLGPYSGSAETSYTAITGQANAYQVAFMISWFDIFQRSHTWTLNVAPTGAVSYVSDSGDGLP